MARCRPSIPATLAGLFAALSLTTVAGPVALADTAARCQVRNVTQGTAGGSLRAMVAAAVDGDALTVRGTSGGGPIRADLSILLEGSSVTDNASDDCVGTPAC